MRAFGMEQKYLDRSGSESTKIKDKAAYVLMNTPLKSSKRAFLVVQTRGSLLPGDWSQEAEILHSLKIGSQIDYTENALNEGLDVILANPNGNIDIEEDKTYPPPSREPANQHMIRVWEYMMLHYAEIFIVAHGHGCKLVIDLNEVKNVTRMAKIAFIDSNPFLGQFSQKQLYPFAQVTRRYEMECPSDDDNCETVETNELDLMPFKARKNIFSYFGIPYHEKSTEMRPRSKTAPSNSDSITVE